MKNLFNYILDLQHFSGEGEVAVSGESGEKSAAAGQENTVYPNEEFSQLISGEFKSLFSEKIQEIIDKRFKQTKELEAYKSKVTPVMEHLMKIYGLSAGDESQLLGRLSSDSANYTQEAENKELSNENKLKNKIGSWIKDSEVLKETVPDFDLRKELKENKLFSQLLLSGVPLDAAYETVHRDEFISKAMHYTADAVRQQMVQNIEAKGRRPIENGVSAESAIVTSVDVNSLTSQDILKILKQVENGASIKF